MSDFSIPGTGNSKYGTEKLIEGLMKLERAPREKTAERVKGLESQKTVWLDFNQRLGTLREGARSLYSFKNPFSERIAKASDEEVLSATATREALEQTRTVLVKRVAAADRFLSAELPKDYRVPAGTYTFRVGEKNLDLRYSGGSIQDFAESISRKGKDLLRAQVVAVNTDTRSLVVESLKTGAASRLGFEGDAAKLALETGIVEKIETRRRDFDPTKIVAWEKPIDRSAVKTESGFLSIAAGGEAKLPVLPSVKAAGMVLELEYRMIRLPSPEAPSPPPGPAIGPTGTVSFEGISVTGAPSATGMPEWTPPPMPPRVEDLAMVNLLAPEGRSIVLPELQDGESAKTLRVAMSDYLGEASGIAFRVKDTTRRLEVLKARFLDPTEIGGYRPLKPVSTAQDALLAVDGIETVRPTNEISDMIPGVSLNLKNASDKQIKVKVEPNRAAAKEAIIALVGNYNRLMGQINILSRNDERIINEIAYFNDDEKKAAKERLGLLQGDSTISLLRSALQRIASNPYETKDGSEMALLAQIGVASDARRPGAGQGYDATKMRGYIEIEEETLTKALETRFEAVKQLFGNDTDGDLIVNAGVAYALDNGLKPYVETGGIISLKTGTIDSQIRTEKRNLENMDRQLIAKEADLKRKYGMMESSLNRMQGTSNSITNAFSSTGSQ